MKKLLTVLLLIGVVLSITGSAFAWTMVDTGAYWAQNTSDTGGLSFNKIGLSWISGAQFATPALLDYSNFGSFAVTGDATSAMATGPLSDNIGFNVSFLGSLPASANFLIGVFKDNTLLMLARDWYPDGSTGNVKGWQYEYLTGNQKVWPSSAVPEPATMSLLGLGLLGLFGLGKKRA